MVVFSLKGGLTFHIPEITSVSVSYTPISAPSRSGGDSPWSEAIHASAFSRSYTTVWSSVSKQPNRSGNDCLHRCPVDDGYSRGDSADACTRVGSPDE